MDYTHSNAARRAADPGLPDSEGEHIGLRRSKSKR